MSLISTQSRESKLAHPPFNGFNQQRDEKWGKQTSCRGRGLAASGLMAVMVEELGRGGTTNTVQGRVSLSPLAGVTSSHGCKRVMCVKLAPA